MVMRTGLRFLMAAKRCEMADLEQLARTSALVDTTARMIHALQRERGLSNLYLGSAGQHAGDERLAQIAASQAPEAALRSCLDALNTNAAMLNGARLFSRIAYVLHGLEALPSLRQQVANLAWPAARATEAYARLVGGLLAVVFEAADTASDPDISRLLVGLFNFMQGKEFVGQERATGAAMFAAGHTSPQQQQRLLRLIESQERCLEVFGDFAGPELLNLWTHHCQQAPMAELERLRRILCTTTASQSLPTASSETWFAGCSERIDHMRAVEEQICQALQALCVRKLAQAAQELDNLERLKTSMAQRATEEPPDMSFFEVLLTSEVHAPAHPLGSHLDRAVLDLLHAQAGRLQKVSDELDTVRASLNERKVIERAKGLLMAHRQLSEEDAHRTIRQMAMNQGRRLVEVAEAVLSMAEVLPLRGR
jgi:hypothetical protein